MSLRRLWAIIRKEIIQIKRDPPSLVIVFVMPIMMLLLFGYAVTTDVEHIATAVLDQDKTPQSRSLIDSLGHMSYYDLNYFVSNIQEIEELMDAGKIKTAFVIPSGYAKEIYRGTQAQVQVLIDGSDPLIARTAFSTAQVLGQVKSLELLGAATGLGVAGGPLIDLRPRVLYNPEMKSVKFNIPGLIGLIMQNITIMLTAFALVRERERGTLEQLIITPIRRTELILGKLTPYVFIAFMDVIVILLFGIYWFKVPVAGSIPLLLSLSVVFLFVALGFGMLISTVAKNQLQAMQMTILILLPSVLLSGFMFPREAMPKIIQFLGYGIPLTYFLEILRGIILKGIPFKYLWQDVMLLGFLGFLLLTIATLRFNKRLD